MSAVSPRRPDGGVPRDPGDETGDASSPRPDENVASEIGEEVGVEPGDDEMHDVQGRLLRRLEDAPLAARRPPVPESGAARRW